ncbi:hypothetical protein PIB30_066922 [Stylosanthes scabra]|uniref:Uncharacterized protein n=1 Tax=Stylosanthes scabra TaxID=79078 RepID=A0ABU6SND6_9FABA|nr:hypothetical protein [Stylosanthes scabra]
MPKMPRTLDAAESTHDRVVNHHGSLAIRQMRNRPPRALPKSPRTSKQPSARSSFGTTRIKQQAVKALLAAKYNKKIKKWDLEEGDLVLRRADIGGKNAAQGKLGANWEGLTG